MAPATGAISLPCGTMTGRQSVVLRPRNSADESSMSRNPLRLAASVVPMPIAALSATITLAAPARYAARTTAFTTNGLVVAPVR
jgi:hypothetical protein